MTKTNSSIVPARGGELELADKKLLTEYLLLVRHELETNTKLQRIVTRSEPALEARGQVIQYLSKRVKPNTLAIFRKAVEQVLSELDQLRQQKPSLYLVDQSTGNLMMPVDSNLIFTPPDYVGEDGKIHKSNSIVHPGISSTLAMVIHKRTKINKAIAESKKNPATEQAYAHLTDPDKIIELTKEKLVAAGMQVNESLPKSENHTIEFGREQSNGIFQSSNLYFHRIQMFSSTLAHKIIKLKYRQCAFGKLETKHNSKQQWYSIEVRLSD